MDPLAGSFLDPPKHPRRRTVVCHHRGEVYGPRSSVATPEPGFESPLSGVPRTPRIPQSHFAPMTAVCERVSVFKNLIGARTHAIFQYFGVFPGWIRKPDRTASA
jgi:hypothetical protein